MARYRFVGFYPTDFPSLRIGRRLEPPIFDEAGLPVEDSFDEFELDDDVEVSHALIEWDDGSEWQPTVEVPETPATVETEPVAGLPPVEVSAEETAAKEEAKRARANRRRERQARAGGES